MTIAASVFAVILGHFGGWPGIAFSALAGVGALLWGFWPRINDNRSPNPILSWRPEPQAYKFSIVVRNTGGRGRFSASALILGSNSTELPKGSEFKLAWNGVEELETTIERSDFKLLRIAHAKDNVVKRSLYQYQLADPVVREMPLPSLKAGKVLSIGSADAGGKRVVWKPGDEPVRLDLRIRLFSDPALVRQKSRVIRLAFDGKVLTAV